MIKVFVFDTNSLISANLSPDSVNRKAYDRAREIGISVYSSATLTEFVETLIRPKFDKYISSEKRLQAISAFEKKSQLIRVFININICRDPKDNKFLELGLKQALPVLLPATKICLFCIHLNAFQY
jgi:putative PIN family toxin of toxin-antitoxin system